MKKYTMIILLFLFSNIVYCGDWNKFGRNMMNGTISYNIGYTNFEKQFITHSIDINAVYFVFNGGFNHEIGRDHKVYLGFGFGMAYQLQIGYGFISNAFILRWRQDWGFGMMFFPPFIGDLEDPFSSENKCINFFLERFSFGYYIENKFTKGGFSAGLTIGMRLFY